MLGQQSLPVSNISMISVLDVRLARTPVNPLAMLPYLIKYPNKKAAAFLYSGFTSGFRIPYTGPRVATDCSNLKSARELPDVIRTKIAKECEAGRVAGPFSQPPLANLRVSPLGVVPKKVPGEYRLIHHLSYPKGSSVNDAIAPELCSVRYASMDHALSIIRSCGPGALMAKCDIQSAFRLLPVHPEDFCLLGFKFEGNWYVDKAMPMGCAVACSAFEAFSTFLEFVAKTRSACPHITHYLDDFLMVGPAGTSACADRLATFKAIAAEFGVPLAADKTVGPATCLTYLGIELDTVKGTSSLPLEKLHKLRVLLGELSGKKKCTLKELQSVLGHLNFACRVVAPGRAFCARLARSTSCVSKPHHHVRVTEGLRADISVWLEFLSQFNGVSMWQTPMPLEDTLQVHSDAAGSLGFGVFFDNRWCAQRWPTSWANSGILRDLTFLELFPILVAVCLWREHFKDRKVLFWCDNQAVVRVINRQTSRSERVMRLVRKLVLTCLQANISFSARYVPGTSNCIADALSRFQEDRFRELAPEARQCPESFMEELWNLGSA